MPHAPLSDAERDAFERWLAREARRFDLRPLLDLLRDKGYAREDILFEGAHEGSSSPSIVEAVRFRRWPAPGAVVTLNLGLLGDGALLPSYFLEVVESLPRPERFHDFIRFFDHRLVEGFLRAVYPEQEGGPFGDFDRVLRAYFRMLGPGSISTMQWLWQLYFPELPVRVTRQAAARETRSHAFRTGESRLDGTGILGMVYPWDASELVVELVAEDETDDRGRRWPGLIEARMSERVLPLLAPFHVPLLVRLRVLYHATWARLDTPGAADPSYLGYERLRGDPATGHTTILYRGVTGEPQPE